MEFFLTNPDYQRANNVFEFTVFDLNGVKVHLSKYTGHVCLFVNIASRSKCAKAYMKQLNDIHKKFYDRGVRILAFPCNQFGKEEPGSRVEIAAWVQEMGAQFDVFDKVDVNSNSASPVWKYLKHMVRHPGPDRLRVIKWNFNIFITNRFGVPQQRFGIEAKQEEIEAALEDYLATYS